MIGELLAKIDQADFLRGMSSGPDINDGGFSSEVEGVNIKSIPGVMYAAPTGVDSDTDNVMGGDIVATSPDHSTRVRIAVNSAGEAVSYNGTKLAAVHNTDGVNTYAAGFSHMANFGGETYYTSKQKAKQWAGTATFDGGAGFPFTFATATVPHPVIAFQDGLFFGDGNLLLRTLTIGVAPTTILTLPADQVIIALGIDPGTGKMLISTTTNWDTAGTGVNTGLNKLKWYDGSSNKTDKTVIVGDQILSFETVGSTTYCGYGTSLGQINGSGVQWLRDLNNVRYFQNELPYQHKITSSGNILYVSNGLEVLAYGEVQAGRKIFWTALTQKVSSATIKALFACGNTASSDTQKLGISYTSSQFDTYDLTSTSNVDLFKFVSNRIQFQRPVHIYNIVLEFKDALTSTDNLTLVIQNQDTSGNTVSVPTQTSVRTIRKTTGFHSKYEACKFSIEDSTNNAGLRRILIYGKVAD